MPGRVRHGCARAVSQRYAEHRSAQLPGRNQGPRGKPCRGRRRPPCRCHDSPLFDNLMGGSTTRVSRRKPWDSPDFSRTEEMVPKWFKMNEIPYQFMVGGRPRRALNGSGKKLSSTSHIYFAKHQKAILGASSPAGSIIVRIRMPWQRGISGGVGDTGR